MKKKSIFVVALAALMLIAFTACEQPVPGLSKSIIDATIVQDGTFLVGQPFDASKFSVNVTYSDKSTGTLDGVNVVYVGGGQGASAASVANGDKVQVTLPVSAPNYSGSNNTVKNVTFEGAIVAYKFSSLTITGTTTLPYDTTEDEFVGDVELTVVGNYKDSTGAAQTVTLDADEYTVVGPVLRGAEPTEDEAAEAYVNVIPAFGGLSAVSYDFDATLYEGPAPAYTYKFTGNVYYTVAEDSISNAYVNRGLFNASQIITVYKEMQAYDEDDRLVSGEIEYEAIPYNDDLQVTLAAPMATTDGSIRYPATGTSATVNVSYRYADETGKYVAATVKGGLKEGDNGLEADTSVTSSTIAITLRADYPTNFSASWIGNGGTGHEGVPYDVTSAQATVNKTDFSYTITWKSGYATAPTTYQSSIKMKLADATGDPSDSITINQGADAGSETVEFTYQITGATLGYSDSVTEAEASITVANSTT